MKKKNMSTVTISPTTLAMKSERAPLYCRVRSEAMPGPAYVELDPLRRYVHAGRNAMRHEPTPIEVHLNRVIRVPVPSAINGEALIEWLTSQDSLHLIERICDGWSKEVDSNGNACGSLDDNATEALEHLKSTAGKFDAQDDCTDFWTDVGLFIGDDLRRCWPHGSVKDAAAALVEEADRNGVHFEHDQASVETALLDLAQKYLRNDPARLDEHHVEGVRKAGRI